MEQVRTLCELGIFLLFAALTLWERPIIEGTYVPHPRRISLGFGHVGFSKRKKKESMDGYAVVAQTFEEVAKDISYSDLVFPLGIVPMEQLVQFQFVLCAFHERAHMQLYLRQGSKLSTDLFLVFLFITWMVIAQSLAGPICEKVVPLYALSQGFSGIIVSAEQLCHCILTRLWSGQVNFTHVVRGFTLLLIDACETVASFRDQKNSVRASHRRVVFQWGTVKKLNHVFTFHVSHLTNTAHFARLLKSFALFKSGTDPTEYFCYWYDNQRLDMTTSW